MSTATTTRPVTEESVSASPDTPWVTIVWDDPVNTMAYVTYVFCTYFGFPRAKAAKLMMQVHTVGKAVVSTGNREQMEVDTAAMHSYGLQATLQRQDGP